MLLSNCLCITKISPNYSEYYVKYNDKNYIKIIKKNKTKFVIIDERPMTNKQIKLAIAKVKNLGIKNAWNCFYQIIQNYIITNYLSHLIYYLLIISNGIALKIIKKIYT